MDNLLTNIPTCSIQVMSITVIESGGVFTLLLFSRPAADVHGLVLRLRCSSPIILVDMTMRHLLNVILELSRDCLCNRSNNTRVNERVQYK